MFSPFTENAYTKPLAGQILNMQYVFNYTYNIRGTI